MHLCAFKLHEQQRSGPWLRLLHEIPALHLSLFLYGLSKSK
jgi:hypothetical protein